MTIRRSSIFALALGMAFYLFELVARIEPGLAIDQIATDFDLSNASVGTLASLFFWVYAPMQLVVGILLDRYGIRRLIAPAMALCAGGVLLFGMTDVVWLAAAGRIATGLGASFAFVGALYVVNHRFAPNRFALLSGLVNMVGMLGTAVGAILLTDLISTAGWRGVFIGTGCVGLALCVLAYIGFRHEDAEPPEVHASALAGLGEIVSNGRIWLIALAGALYYVPVNVFGGLWGQNDLVVDHGLDPMAAETAVAMIFLGMATGSVAAGAISDRLGHRKWIVASNALVCAAAYAIAIYTELSSVVALSLVLFVAGLMGGAQMLTFAMAKEGFAAANSAKVIAFVNMVGIGGAIIFQPLVGGLIDLTGENFQLALTVVPLSALLAAGLIAFVRETRHPDHA